MFNQSSRPCRGMRDTLSPHFTLHKTRSLDVLWLAIMFGLVNCRKICEPTHLAAHLPGKALYKSKYCAVQHFFKKVATTFDQANC